MTPDAKRPFITLLASHWVSLLGVALTTTAGFSWLFVLPTHLRGHAGDPYIGILIFLIIPAILFAGLALIPIGVFLARRQVMAGLRALPDRRTSWRRLGTFLGLMTFVNLVIGSQATYRAVVHMETDQFCGQSCHVMKPEFTAWKHAPHSSVQCVECHIAPGASGWVAAKAAGSAQMIAVILNTFPRPIESAMESNKLVSSADTCEHCHDRSREIGTPVRVFPAFKDDEANTRTETVLTLRVGGAASGIHGAHMGPGITIRYAAADAKRQTIPWVEYKDAKGGVQTFVSSDAKPGSIDSLPKFEMQCVDCHNRPAHSFQTADRAMNNALQSGELPSGLPFIKKTGLALITASYATSDAAAQDIPAKLTQFYQSKYPDVYGKQQATVEAAGKALLDIYNRNVFPDLKVTWGTYPNNLGHTDAPGCFRCHDGSHTSANKKTIDNDCMTCHQIVATDEASPEVLKTLGITSQK
jgi:nitrate/TMAO reductase-like tetraheme cytochrome c subunit